LVEELADQGISVRATTRLLSRVRPLRNVEWVRCDVTSENELRTALEGIETVFHCAAIVGAPASFEDYREANVEGTLRLVRLAAETGVRDVVYVSSMSVYGIPRDGTSYLDETVPYDERAGDRGVYTQTKLAAERSLLEYAAVHETPRVVVLRPGTIYGPGAPLPVGNLRLPSTVRRPIVAGGRGTSVPLTFVDNLVDAMLLARKSDVPTGSVYNIVDSADTQQGEIARILADASEGRVRPVFLPYAVVWTLMLGVDLLALVRRRRLGTARFRLKRTLALMRFSAAAARTELGWRPQVDLVEGLGRVLAESDGTPGLP
jgi:nucleoside-diphosphate-sugar epimerase